MPPLLKTLRWLLAGLVLGYLLLCADVYRKQDALLFPAQTLDQHRAAQLELDHPGSGYTLKTRDGITLRGWLDVPAPTGPHPLLLYFGGNKDEVSNWMLMRHQAPDWAWASLNYRGYGASEGEPSQTALVADAQAVFDALAADPRIDPKRIVVIGRSLGSGVAVQLAAKRPLQALILITPYDSMLSVAAEKYPYLPIRWMLRHPFDSIALAPPCTCRRKFCWRRKTNSFRPPTALASRQPGDRRCSHSCCLAPTITISCCIRSSGWM
jgi:pimeloyl-ACP methyl ester carboxylesterase